MIRHVALLKWKPDADPVLLERFRTGMQELPGKLPGILRFSCGSNVGESKEGIVVDVGFSGNFDFAIVVDLEDHDAYKVYADHAEHQLFIGEVVRHIVEQRVAVQYDVGEFPAYTPS